MMTELIGALDQASAKKTFTTVSGERTDEFINPNPSVGNGRFVWRAAPLILVIGYAYDASKATIEGKIPVEPAYDIDATVVVSATGTFDVDVVDTANPPASSRAFVESVPHQLGLKLVPATGKVDVLIVDGFKML